jgi:hypothetical protein
LCALNLISAFLWKHFKKGKKVKNRTCDKNKIDLIPLLLPYCISGNVHLSNFWFLSFTEMHKNNPVQKVFNRYIQLEFNSHTNDLFNIVSEYYDWLHLPIAWRWGLLEPPVGQVIVTLGWKTIDVTKSICWKVQRHSLRDTCHSRTVLSMEDDKIKWFWRILYSRIIYLKLSIVKILST